MSDGSRSFSPPSLRGSETEIRAELCETTNGPVWRAIAHYGLDYTHGRTALRDLRTWDSAGFALTTKEPRACALEAGDWLLVDVESTGLGMSGGTYAFLVGFGYLQDDAFVIEQYLMRNPGEEPALLDAVQQVMQRHPALLSFNGKTYDLPLLQTRARRARVVDLESDKPHADLLHVSRRLWSGRNTDCRLSTLERRHLGLLRQNDVAGADIPQLYFDYLRSGQPEPLDDVLRHNRFDLLSLALLAVRASRFLQDVRAQQATPRVTVLVSEGRLHLEERLRAARLLLDAGQVAEGVALLQSCCSTDAPRDVRARAQTHLARLYKRSRELESACALWEDLVRCDPEQIEPYEELAKVLEHKRHDPAGALQWVEKRMIRGGLEPYQIESLEHRAERLRRKLSNSSDFRGATLGCNERLQERLPAVPSPARSDP